MQLTEGGALRETIPQLGATLPTSSMTNVIEARVAARSGAHERVAVLRDRSPSARLVHMRAVCGQRLHACTPTPFTPSSRL